MARLLSNPEATLVYGSRETGSTAGMTSVLVVDALASNRPYSWFRKPRKRKTDKRPKPDPKATVAKHGQGCPPAVKVAATSEKE